MIFNAVIKDFTRARSHVFSAVDLPPMQEIISSTKKIDKCYIGLEYIKRINY